MVWGTLLAGAIGGFLANFGAQYLWRWWRKPELKFKHENSVTWVKDDASESYPQREFRVSITNTGKTAAHNCRPRITFQGVSEKTEYLIETTSYWIESDNPSTITINPGDTVSFPVCKKSSGKEASLWFPIEGGWSEGKNIVQRYPADFVDDISFEDSISASIFDDANWKKKDVCVSSENTDMISGEFDIAYDEDVRGMIGEKVVISEKEASRT